MHLEDAELIESLARWRMRNMAAYPTQFPVRFEGTLSWLRDKVLAVPDRIMFLVLGPAARPIGHAGFADVLNDERSVRLDNVMRGIDDGPPGVMSVAVSALIGWLFDAVGPRVLWVKVFSDNDAVIPFLRRLGFRDDVLVPLRRVLDGRRVEYLPADGSDGPADRYHLRMVLAPPEVPPFERHSGIDS